MTYNTDEVYKAYEKWYKAEGDKVSRYYTDAILEFASVLWEELKGFEQFHSQETWTGKDIPGQYRTMS